MVFTIQTTLSRRFIRHKAIQHLYSFYIHKQANYHVALEQIRQELAFDIFATAPTNREQQTINQKNALELFSGWVSMDQKDTHTLDAYPMPVQKAVKHAQNTYTFSVKKDAEVLTRNWDTTLDSLQKNCVLILQLLVELQQAAQKQAGKVTLSNQHLPDQGIKLINNQLLTTLQTHAHFQQLLQKHHINWTQHTELVWNWYQNYFNNNIDWKDSSINQSTTEKEKALLYFLLEKVIFKQEPIQDFFNELDLAWPTHKSIVKKLLWQLLDDLYKKNEKNVSLAFIGVNKEWDAATDFYNQLIAHTLSQEHTLEKIIKQYIENWSIERIVLLDKVIIKLALAEMMYLVNIPTKVSINEYIELSKIYSTPSSRNFINGILDAVSKTFNKELLKD